MKRLFLVALLLVLAAPAVAHATDRDVFRAMTEGARPLKKLNREARLAVERVRATDGSRSAYRALRYNRLRTMAVINKRYIDGVKERKPSTDLVRRGKRALLTALRLRSHALHIEYDAIGYGLDGLIGRFHNGYKRIHRLQRPLRQRFRVAERLLLRAGYALR